MAHFFGPVSCTVNAPGPGVLGTVDLADNSKVQTDFYYGTTGNLVKVSCDAPGGTSKAVSFEWPN